MANQIDIRYYYKSTSWVIESSITSTSDVDFPRDVFLWSVAENGSLGSFQAIGHADQVARYPLHDSNRTNNFGIHLVRSDRSYQEVATEQERDDVIIVLKSAFRFLLTSFAEQSIPTEETYPVAQP